MAHESGLSKSMSATSFTSSKLDDEELEIDDLEFETAPYDILGYHPRIGNKLVAKEGTKLPVLTNYFKIDAKQTYTEFPILQCKLLFIIEI